MQYAVANISRLSDGYGLQLVYYLLRDLLMSLAAKPY